MTYTWSEEQWRGLTFGSTVEIGGERRVFRGFENEFYGTLIFEPDDLRGISTGEIDPSTLRPPSVEWIRELAKERLGRDSEVEDEFGSVKVAWNDGGCLLAFTDAAGMDRFRAAVNAIVALANAGLGRKGGGDGCEG